MLVGFEMGFKDLFLNKPNIDDKTIEIMRDYIQTEKEFIILIKGMFSKENAEVFNKIVPEKYLPENVMKRVKGLTGSSDILKEYKEANINYKQIIFLNSCNPDYFSYC